MDYRGVQAASTAGRTPAARKTSQQRASNDHNLHYDSDRSTTLDSLKDLIAFGQRPPHVRQNDILFAAKNARAQMPPQFREPPSSTGSHGTITGTIDLCRHGDRGDRGEDLTVDSDASSSFSAGPDAESTRHTANYQRGSHRVQRSTGRFTKARGDGDKKSTTDILNGVVNTSALFRTFKEWKPEDGEDDKDDSEADVYEDGDASTTNFGLVNKASRFDQENCQPTPSSPPAQPKTKPASRHRHVLQPTVQNESDLSLSMVLPPTQKAKTKTAQPSPLRKASSALAPAPILKKSGSTRETVAKKQVSVVESVYDDDEHLTSPETSAGSREDIDLGVQVAPRPARSVARPAAKGHTSLARQAAPAAPAAPAKANAVTRADTMDGATNQSFIVPSKSFPLLHNLVTGTLKFTPGTYAYGNTADAQRKYQLPAGTLPDDEKEIFVDIDSIREEVVRLQEHDEMLQNEIVQGEAKYKSLLDRFYSLAQKSSDHAIASAAYDDPMREAREENELLHEKIQELEIDLDVVQAQYEEHAQSSAKTETELKEAVQRAHAESARADQLAADLEAVRERMAASAQRPNQEAQRRIQQLETMVSERERVIKALKDEREAATSSHREACKLYRERIARLEAEKTMLASDHAKCGDEKYALTTAKEALALKNSALKKKVQAARHHVKERESAAHVVVERQRSQIARLQTLVREKEKCVFQLDENFRKLRESWSAKDETIMRMNEMLPEAQRVGVDTAEPTEELDGDTHDFYFEQADKDDLAAHDDRDVLADELLESDPDSDSDSDSDNDRSVDENMTSAFILPDINMEADDADEEEEEAEEDANTEEAAAAAVNKRELERELAQAQSIKARNASHKTAGQHKSVSFQTTTRTSTTTTSKTTMCKHNRVNCVVCCQYQKAGPADEKERVTVTVPRPLKGEDVLPDTSMDPGSALAYVMKLLDDERRHLWMQIQAMRKAGEAQEALNDERRPRRALREAEELWKSYVLKVEQLNRLDDVLEGQRAAGQDMTREEIDVTITRILEA